MNDWKHKLKKNNTNPLRRPKILNLNHGAWHQGEHLSSKKATSPWNCLNANSHIKSKTKIHPTLESQSLDKSKVLESPLPLETLLEALNLCGSSLFPLLSAPFQ